MLRPPRSSVWVVVLALLGHTSAQDCCPHNPDRCPSDDVRVLRVPRGFCLSYFAEPGMIRRPRDIEVREHPDLGTVVFVSGSGVSAIQDEDQDGVADRVLRTWSPGTGVAFDPDGIMYTSTGGALMRYDDIFADLIADVEPRRTNIWPIPEGGGHRSRYMAIDSQGYAYVGISVPCNICLPESGTCDTDTYGECNFATIMRGNVSGKTAPMSNDEWEVYAHGIRSVIGFAFHPEDDALWFSDNGRDWWGDDRPPCEINRAAEPGMHFGYPFCHGYNEMDDDIAEQINRETDCSEYEPNKLGLGAHTAPLGITFYTNTDGNFSFPPPYNSGLFVTEHGSWNRLPHVGARVMHVHIDENMNAYATREPILDGFMTDSCVPTRIGRPADVETLPDGSLLVSDDAGHTVWRITWEGTEEDAQHIGLGSSVDEERANLTCSDNTLPLTTSQTSQISQTSQTSAPIETGNPDTTLDSSGDGLQTPHVITLSVVLPVLVLAAIGGCIYFFRRHKHSGTEDMHNGQSIEPVLGGDLDEPSYTLSQTAAEPRGDPPFVGSVLSADREEATESETSAMRPTS